MTTLRPLALLLFVGILLVVLGQGLGGWLAGWLALGVALVVAYIAWFRGDRLILAAYRAQPLPRAQASTLYRLVQEISRDAEMPRPRLYRIASTSANAFSTGRDRSCASLVVTDGLLEQLAEDELAGVVAHELSHIYSRTSHSQTVAAALAAMIVWPVQVLFFRHHRPSGNPLAQLLGLLFGLPAALVLHLGISPNRELVADESAARLTRNPLALARALEKLEKLAEARPLLAPPAYRGSLIVVGPARTLLENLFSTHPATRDRLQSLALIDKELVRQANNATISAMDL